MSLGAFALVLLGLAAVSFLSARARAATYAGGGTRGVLHSRPNYHGTRAALIALVPAALLLFAWMIVGDTVVAQQVLSVLPAELRPEPGLAQQSFLNEVRGVVSGDLPAAFSDAANSAVPIYRAAEAQWDAGDRAARGPAGGDRRRLCLAEYAAGAACAPRTSSASPWSRSVSPR